MYSSPEAAEGQDLSGLTIMPPAARPRRSASRSVRWRAWAPNIIHLYGLTETYGPMHRSACRTAREWDDMSSRGAGAFAKAKQGVPYVVRGHRPPRRRRSR